VAHSLRLLQRVYLPWQVGLFRPLLSDAFSNAFLRRFRAAHSLRRLQRVGLFRPLLSDASGWPTLCGVCKGWGFFDRFSPTLLYASFHTSLAPSPSSLHPKNPRTNLEQLRLLPSRNQIPAKLHRLHPHRHLHKSTPTAPRPQFPGKQELIGNDAGSPRKVRQVLRSLTSTEPTRF